MQTQKESSKNIAQFLTIGLVVGIIFAYSEIKTLWLPDQVWGKLLTPIGIVTISLYIFLAIAGLAILIFSLWESQHIQMLAKKLVSIRWPIALVLTAFIAWMYLFSSWQATFTFPWTQFILAASLARLLAWIFIPEQNYPFSWSELVLAFSIFLYPRLVQELRIVYPMPFLTRGAIIGGGVFLLGLIYILYQPFGESLRAKLLDFRIRLGLVRRIFIYIALLSPLIYRYMIGAGGYILYPNIRFALWLVALWVAAYLLCAESGRIVTLEAMLISMGWLVLVSAIARSLLLVVSTPFSLSWSEGNRFYDYSLIFGQDLYNYAGGIPNPYSSPGRYVLWGWLFLLSGLPIWVHRLWNVVLLTMPSFVLAWLLTRKIQAVFLRSALFLWIAAFFILLAPLHPPFMLVMIIVTLFAFYPSPYIRGMSLFVASLYAGVSRWTWVFAPGAWGALIDLFLYYPKREGNWIKRLLPSVFMALLGALPGFLLNIREFFGYSSGENLTGQQPLLWYRLLPNQTLGTGIVLLILLTTGPLVALFLYKLFSRKWKLDAFQLVAILVALIGFLAVGLVISTKIGGGGDLHNLDMFIGTLIIVIMLGLISQPQGPSVTRWPAWVLAILCFVAFLPVYQFTPFFPSAATHAWLDVPTQSEADTVLEQIRVAVKDASVHGEVLFMDQRQLLTFGYIPAVPFIPEYEKKYMMDQAMASNEAYFLPYYQDLASHRFTLIVTEPLKINIKGSGPFSEENDLWVSWVSAPTLCFYEPIMIDKKIGVQLLVPRIETAGCEKYLP